MLLVKIWWNQFCYFILAFLGCTHISYIYIFINLFTCLFIFYCITIVWICLVHYSKWFAYNHMKATVSWLALMFLTLAFSVFRHVFPPGKDGGQGEKCGTFSVAGVHEQTPVKGTVTCRTESLNLEGIFTLETGVLGSLCIHRGLYEQTSVSIEFGWGIPIYTDRPNFRDDIVCMEEELQQTWSFHSVSKTYWICPKEQEQTSDNKRFAFCLGFFNPSVVWDRQRDFDRLQTLNI